MKLLLNENEYKLITKSSNIQLGDKVDDAFFSENELCNLVGGINDGFWTFNGQRTEVFNGKFKIMLIIFGGIISSICLTLIDGAPTSQKREGYDGIYSDDLCKLEVQKLIELITNGLGRKYDRFRDGPNGQSAIWHTQWGSISVRYEERTPSVGVYLSNT